jgi:inhibitor of KinA sporulation pathway (predicted exonuclease)
VATKKRLDQILVIDIEATCWEGPAPAGQVSEIIEIGLCTLDVASGQRLTKRSLLVRPERSSVSTFCAQLTSLTPEQVTQGISFADACYLLQHEYAAAELVWASYGEYDREMFMRQCRERQIDYPFGSRHINVKTLFALVHALHREVGMAAALGIAHLDLEGVHHRGDDDAWNIAALLASILQNSRR